VGLLGKPESQESYEACPVEGSGDLTCWVHEDVIDYIESHLLPGGGFYLFYNDMAGRVRFKISDE